MAETTPPLLKINNFQSGIAKSPHIGFADFKNLDIDSQPGAVSLNLRANQQSYTPFSAVAFTRSGDTLVNTVYDFADTAFAATIYGNNIRAVKFTGADLPDPLVQGTTYWLIYVGFAISKVATTYNNAVAGTFITLNDAGSGAMTMASVDMVIIQGIVKDINSGIYYAVDDDGRVWKRPVGEEVWYSINCEADLTNAALTTAYGKGIAIWKDYLVVYRIVGGNLNLDFFGNLSTGTATWVGTITTGQATNALWSHHSFVSRNGKLYWGNGRYVGSLLEVDGQTFDPTNAATYTLTAAALDLQKYTVINCISEIETNLLIGTNFGIFTWNKNDTSFENQLFPGENVYAIVNKGGLAYFIGGTKRELNVTNGVSWKKLIEVPQHLQDLRSSTPSIYPYAICINEDKVYWGVSQVSTSCGIWSYNIETGALVFENQLSSLTTDYVGALFTVGYKQIFAGISGKIYITGSHSCTGYIGYFISPFYMIGHKLSTPTLERLEFELDRPMITGEGVRISYRNTLNASFTVLGTYEFATWGAQQIMNVKFGNKTNTVQLKVELTTSNAGAGATKYTSPILREVRIW